VIILVLNFSGLNYEWMPAVLFLAYLLYGVLRSWLSRDWRREIEEEIGEEPSEEATEQGR
jgi:CDP-diacylglycerol--serine O-phosphatidyltransferase